MLHRDKWPLYIGILLPIILIVYIAATSYIPGLFIKPQYNFIYAIGDRYGYTIEVVNQRIVVNSQQPTQTYNPYPTYPPYNRPTFYLYNVKASKNTQIALNDIANYMVDPSDKSPDGFTVGPVENGGYGFFPLFYDGYQRGIVLTGRGLHKKITDNDSYNFRFIGWVTQ